MAPAAPLTAISIISVYGSDYLMPFIENTGSQSFTWPAIQNIDCSSDHPGLGLHAHVLALAIRDLHQDHPGRRRLKPESNGEIL